MKWIKRLFWPSFITVLTAAILLLLWNGQKESGSYRDLACAFEDKSSTCLEFNADWNRGLAFYDSTLSVSGDTLGSLKNLLWNFWNIEFAGAGEASISREAVLPLNVLASRKSGCMGLAWLAMMVAESRQIPLQVILLPGHVFLKYHCEDGAGEQCVNLEPNREGYSYTDDEYREKYKAGPWTGLEFSPLSSRQFVGLVAFNMGNLFLEKDPRQALTWYRMAEDFFGEYPGISINQKIAKSRLPDHL